MVAGWVIDPQGWQNEPIVRVRADVAALAGLPSGTRYASFRDLVSRPALIEALRAAEERARREEKGPKLDEHLVELSDRLTTLQAYFRGEMLRIEPAADPNAAWGAVRPPSAAALLAAVEQIRGRAPAHYPTREAIARELRYTRADTTQLAWWLLVPAALAAGFTLTRDRKLLLWIARVGIVAGFAVMTWGIAQRWLVAGRIPASNMYESMLFLAWGVGLFAVISLAARQPHPDLQLGGDVGARHAPPRPPADGSVHPPDAAGALGHAVARDPRADHHGELRHARHRHALRPRRGRGGDLRPPAPRDGPALEPARLLVHPRRLDPAHRRHPHRLDLGRLVVGPLLGLGSEGGLVAGGVPRLHGDPARPLRQADRGLRRRRRRRSPPSG